MAAHVLTRGEAGGPTGAEGRLPAAARSPEMEKQRRNPGDAAWRACVGQQKGGGGPRDGYWRRVASQGGEGQQAGGAYRGGDGLP